MDLKLILLVTSDVANCIYIVRKICRSSDFMVTIFIIYARSIIGFYSMVWKIGYINDTKFLEAIKHHWT